MMPVRLPGWDLVLLGLALAGFVLLAMASDREGRVLLGQLPSRRRKRALRLVGWPLLTAALVVSVLGWNGNFGPVLWFGWLTVAALCVVFGLAGTTPARGRAGGRNEARIPATGPTPDRAAKPITRGPITPGREPGRSSARSSTRRLLTPCLLTLPVLLVIYVAAAAPRAALDRDAGVAAEVGPWSFRLTEEQIGPPAPTAVGIPAKHLVLQFCDRCDGEVRAAWVQLGEPWSTATRGLRFIGERGPREALLPLLAHASSADQVWITVLGKDGRLHRTALPLAAVSPAAAALLAERRP